MKHSRTGKRERFRAVRHVKRPLLWLVFAAICLPSLAFVDSNDNGMSDIWEEQHNNGQLFPPNIDPQADADGDGWSNAEESVAGTDPFSPNPPAGYLSPQIARIPAVFVIPAGGGDPLLESPEAVTVTWPTVPGKHYTLQFTPDLQATNWLAVEAGFIGNGNGVTYSFALEEQDKLFWRVAVTDVDSDNDGLTNAEEHVLGSNPENSDSDGDGVMDAVERARGSDPTKLDTDNDLTNDGADADPLDGAIPWNKTPESSYVVIELGKPPFDPNPVFSYLIKTRQSALGESGHVLMSRDREPYWWATGGWAGVAGPEYYETFIWSPGTNTWSGPLEMPENIRGCGSTIDGQGNVYGLGYGAINDNAPGEDPLPGSKVASLRWEIETPGWKPASAEVASGFSPGFTNDYATMEHTPSMIECFPCLFGASGRFVSKSADGGGTSYQEANLLRLGTMDNTPICTATSDGYGNSVDISDLVIAGEPTGWHAATWLKTTSTTLPPTSQSIMEYKFARLAADGHVTDNTPPAGAARWNLSSLASIDSNYLPTGIHDIVVWSTADGSFQVGTRPAESGALAWKESTQPDATKRIGGKINARGEGLAATKLWRNGNWQPLDSLVDSTLWTNVHGVDINSTGMILATADKTGGGANGAGTPVLLVPMHIVADTNRDGQVTNADYSGKDTWSNKRGAIYVVNCDEDESGQKPAHRPDAIHFTDQGGYAYEDWKILHDNDLEDIAPLVISAMPVLASGYKVFLKFEEAEDLRAIHLYKRIASQEEAIWGSCGVPTTAPWASTDTPPGDNELDITRFIKPPVPGTPATETGKTAAGDHEFGIEGLVFRGMKIPGGTLKDKTGNAGDAGGFSGLVKMTLEIRNAGGTVVGSDTVEIKVAPWIAFGDRQVSEKAHVVNWPTKGSMATLNEPNPMPSGGPYGGLVRTETQLDTATSAGASSQWLQDQVQFGYTQRPGAPPMEVILRMPYYRPPDINGIAPPQPEWPLKLLKAKVSAESSGTGVIQLGKRIGKNEDDPGGDYGGNLEVFPPTTDYPLGCVVLGDTSSEAMRSFLQAQEVQVGGGVGLGCASTKWLQVGHVDEFCYFHGGYRALVADPQLAWSLMDGLGSLRQSTAFFATDEKVESGSITQDTTTAAQRIIHTGLLQQDVGFSQGVIRIWDGPGAGHTAMVAIHDNYVEIKVVFENGVNRALLWPTGTTVASYLDSRNTIPADGLPSGQWQSLPTTQSKFILVQGCKFWEPMDGNTARDFDGQPGYDGIPALLCTEEVWRDQTFANYNQSLVANRINNSRQTLESTIKHKLEFVPVPALFFEEIFGSPPNVKVGAASFMPGATNLQYANGQFFIPRQFGPRTPITGGGTEDIFEKVMVGLPLGKPVIFVDCWDLYHRVWGEIHCGTAVSRSLPDDAWWENLPAN